MGNYIEEHPGNVRPGSPLRAAMQDEDAAEAMRNMPHVSERRLLREALGFADESALANAIGVVPATVRAHEMNQDEKTIFTPQYARFLAVARKAIAAQQ